MKYLHVVMNNMAAALTTTTTTPSLGGTSSSGTALVAKPDVFWNTALGGVLSALLIAIGTVIVVFAIVKAVTSVSQGKPGAALRTVLGAVVIAAFCFQPSLITDLINAGTQVVKAVIDTISSLVSGSGGTPQS